MNIIATLFIFFFLVEISALLMNIIFYYQMENNPENYNHDNYLSSNLISFLKAYELVELIGVVVYLITFYLAIRKW